MDPDFHLSLFTFEKELLEEINNSDVVDIEPGTIILKENEFIKVIPLILEGSIKLRKLDPNGREIIFYHIEPGESCILSITSCLNDKESQAEAIIEKKTRLIVVEAEKQFSYEKEHWNHRQMDTNRTGSGYCSCRNLF